MRRLCAFVLLLLSASPLTAPFSVADAQDLLGTHSATVQAKKAPDEPLVVLCAPPRVDVVMQPHSGKPAQTPASWPHLRASHIVPLRI